MTSKELAILAESALAIDGDNQLAILLYALAGARMVGRDVELAEYVQKWAGNLHDEIEAYQQWVEQNG